MVPRWCGFPPVNEPATQIGSRRLVASSTHGQEQRHEDRDRLQSDSREQRTPRAPAQFVRPYLIATRGDLVTWPEPQAVARLRENTTTTGSCAEHVLDAGQPETADGTGNERSAYRRLKAAGGAPKTITTW